MACNSSDLQLLHFLPVLIDGHIVIYLQCFDVDFTQTATDHRFSAGFEDMHGAHERNGLSFQREQFLQFPRKSRQAAHVHQQQDVIGDLNSRRGRIEGVEPGAGGMQVIKAQVPLSQLFGYVTTLRSLTQGRADPNVEPSHYEEIPRNLAEEIISRAQGQQLVNR